MTAPPRAIAWTAPAMLSFAANSILCRAALGARLADAASFTGLRLASGAAALALLALATRRPPRGGSWVSGAALFAYAAAFSLAYLRIPAGVGALLLFASVQVTMLGWTVARGERPTRRQWVGIAMALAGLCALTLPGAHAPDPLGAALMLLAGVAWGLYSVRGRGATDPLATNADNFLRSLPFAGAFAAASAPLEAAAAGAGLAVASGAVASGLGYAMWYAALPALGVTRAAVVQLVVPALAALGGAALLGERPTARLLVGGAAILAGIAVTSAARSQR